MISELRDENAMISELKRTIEESVSKMADEIIERKTKEFRRELIHQKSEIIATILTEIEVKEEGYREIAIVFRNKRM